ncbi:MAG: hypothetical protein AMJ46_06200 [Latescibacteria bacterium DG_63]|nr:MAG: hypothetical protein AMJ46_06200 [Latescibacteria bacterium DG_63]
MQRVALTILLVFASTLFFCSSADGGFAPCQDTVRAEVVGNTINVYHDQAEWNCCATMVFELIAVQDTFNLLEFETFEVGPCFCICCFDLLTSIAHVPPGDYLVRVLSGHTGEVFGEIWVTVELGPWGEPWLGETAQSPCGGWNVGADDPASSTWGRVKALFR